MFSKTTILFTLVAAAASVLAYPTEIVEQRLVILTTGDNLQLLGEAQAMSPEVGNFGVVPNDYLNPHNIARTARGHA